MFSVTSIIGVIQAGSLQPSTISIGGIFTCPGSPGPSGGIDLQLTVTGPAPGFPTTVFMQTTSAGLAGQGPLGSVAFSIPAWPGAVCGATLTFTVSGNCNGQWTPPQTLNGVIDCLGCPRISDLRAMLGPCQGAPLRQTVNFFATVAVHPNSNAMFTFDFGDGSSSQVNVANPTSNWNNLQPIMASHDYDASAGPFLACLKPPGECPKVCVPVKLDCNSTGCPTSVTGMATVGNCNADGSRTVTYTLTVSPPAPQNSSVEIVWAFGGANTSMQTSATQIVNTSAGPASMITFTTDLPHRSAPYPTVATLIIQIPGRPVCQLPAVNISVDPASCLPCPDPMQPVIVTINVPNSAGWCAPVAMGLAAQLCAQVNWPQPVPANPPAPVRFDWTVKLPDGREATQSSSGPCVSTASGWSGPGSSGGALDLTSAGTYSASAAAVFGANSGLPTDSSGAVTCSLNGPGSFVLAACPSMTPCPALSGLSVTSACADPSKGTLASVTATATVDDPAGVASQFAWNFGDPGSANNQMTSTTPSASHSYANPGSYTVTCSVSSGVPCNGTGRGPSMASATASIPACPTSNGGGGSSSHKFGCDILLYIALILIAISGVLAVIGCILSKVGYPVAAAVLGFIALGLLAIGLVLLGLWWFLCRFFTACQALLDALDFAGVMTTVFAVIVAVLALIAKFADPMLWLCVGAAFFNSVLWGLLLYFLYRVAVAVGCLIQNPSGSGGPPHPHSSSSPLNSSGGGFPPGNPPRPAGPLRMIEQPLITREAGQASAGAGPRLPAVGARSQAVTTVRAAVAAPRPGLGDMIMRATSAVGIQPCASCHERAARLNAWSASLRAAGPQR